MYFILLYHYVENIIEKRAHYRQAHLALAQTYVNRGELLLGGAFMDPVDGAAIIFKVKTKVDVISFVEQDPYVKNGLVTQWSIREWNAVVGTAL